MLNKFVSSIIKNFFDLVEEVKEVVVNLK